MIINFPKYSHIREAERKEMSDLVEQDKLIELRGILSLVYPLLFLILKF